MEEAKEFNDAGSALWMSVEHEHYLLAKHALQEARTHTPSMHGVMATFMIGGKRQDWAAVVALYEETAEGLGYDVEQIARIDVYKDKTSVATISVPEDGGMIQ